LYNAAATIPKFLEVIRSCNTGAAAAKTARPFIVGDRTIGLIMPNGANALRRFHDVYDVSDVAVRLIAGADSVAARSEAVMRTLEVLRDDGSVPMLAGWRAETWPVKHDFFSPPELLIERAAVPLFGVLAYG
jgi:hypothetical protein